MKDKRILKENLVSLIDIIWGQCSPMMHAKLKAEFTTKGKSIDDKDVTLLLKAIKGVSHRFHSTINPYEAVDEGRRKWYALHQGPNDSHAIEHYGGDIANDTVLINYETSEFKKTLHLVALTDKLLAVAFLRRADRARYGDFLRDLRNSYA